MRYLVCAGLLLLGGCVSQPMNEGLRPLKGQPASVAFERLGMPQDEKTVAGKHFYVWKTDHSGSAYGSLDGTQYVCTVRAFVDDGNIVTALDWEGNGYGCAEYVQKLN